MLELKAVTMMAPSVKAVSFAVNWSACLRCGACVSVCVQRQRFVSPFDTIAVDRPCDIGCMLCERVCPTSAITSSSIDNA